jgi:hypothetical protein
MPPVATGAPVRSSEVSTTPSSNGRAHHRARHRRRRTGRERLIWLVPIAVVAAAVLIAIAVSESPGRKNPLVSSTASTTATTSTTFPTASSIPVTSSPRSSTTTSSTPTSSPSTSTTTSSTTTSAPTPVTVPTDDVLIQIINGSGVNDIATTTASGLSSLGFAINGTEDAPSYTYTTSVIQYPAGDLSLADTVLAHLNGPTELVEDSSVPSGEVYLILGSTFTGVAP